MSKKVTRTKMVLGILAAVFLAAEPLMTLWQPLLPPGSYAGIATFIAVCRADLTFYMNSDLTGEDNAATTEN